MNLKILAFPLLIFAIIVFSIWFVYPTYSDLIAARANLNDVRRNLENINQKIQTAERLNAEISSDEKYQGLLTSFLPSGKNEEAVVNELNDITFGESMILYALSFAPAKNSLEDVPVPALDQFGSPIVDSVTGQPVYSETIPKIKSTEAKASVIGDYDKIKGFLRKVSSLKRMNSLASFKISKEKSQVTGAEADSVSSGMLKMEVAVDFKYLEGVKNTIDANDGIFSSGQFNLTALEEIQKNRNTVVPEIRAESGGRQNPFVL